jgi:gamma-glutamyltranspeptidase/glutathione hydrolase
MVGVLDWHMDIQQAISMPRVTNRNGATSLEEDTNVVQLKAELEKKGHTVHIRSLNSGLHGIVLDGGRLVGGADPRREGVVLAQ